MCVTDMLDHILLICAKAEIKDLTVCIVGNVENFRSHAMTLTLIGQCPMLNSFELFSYPCMFKFHMFKFQVD